MRISELRLQPVRTFTTSRGDTVETFLTDEQAVKLMTKRQDALGNFGFGLVEQLHQRKGLSEKQWPWFHKLALELLPEAAKPSWRPEEQEVVVTVDLRVVRAMMDKAAAKLKYPKIRFEMEQGRIQIARAGNRSRTPGAIMVTDGLPYGVNTFYGRVHTDGTWEPARSGCPDWVLEALQGLASDPAGYAALYGKRTGACCFCGLTLTDGRSVAVGYGPICAGNYGLPWGEVNANDTPLAVVPVASLTDELPQEGEEVPVDAPEAVQEDEVTVEDRIAGRPWQDAESVEHKLGAAPWRR